MTEQASLLVSDGASILDASDVGARVLGRRDGGALTGAKWNELLHTETASSLKSAMTSAKKANGEWVEVQRIELSSPRSGWVAVKGSVRSTAEGRFEWRLQRDGAHELIEGWESIAWWLGVSERTARRWAAEEVDPLPIDRASNGYISIPLLRLQEWRDRREVELIRGWDRIAAYLGVSERTARRWHKLGLPVERRGGIWTGRPAALVAWRDARRRK